MRNIRFILSFFLFLGFMAYGQHNESNSKMLVEGSVKGKERNTPIAGVEVSSSKGEYVLTDAFGEFKIWVSKGDELVFESAEFNTVRYRVVSNEDIDVLVEGYSVNTSNTTRSKSIVKKVSLHKQFLDSAETYKKTNIEKSIDFITKSIAELNKRGNKSELAKSLTLLGDVYVYHKQYDLAISSYLDANDSRKSSVTSFLLGKVYVLNKEFEKAEKILKPLIKVKSIVPYQRVEVHEYLGDAYLGMGDTKEAVAFYEEGLLIAQKNQVSPKVTDLNSKIADAYVKDDRAIEAEGYYLNSLQLAEKESPQRSIQEKNKLADFYNIENRYDEEIQIRKQSAVELDKLPEEQKVASNISLRADSISTQRINYKIANAYIAQDNYVDAIPYLQKSIIEAHSDDDLIVQKDATRKLSEVYEHRGEYNKALATYQDYVAVVDTLYVRKEQEISRAARFNREIASKQSRISGLEQERELSQSKYDLAVTSQQLVVESNKRQKWVIYSLVLGMLLTALAAFFFYRSNKQQKLANNLLALKSLRSQMNPHFIFNALNSVNNYIAKSDERSANRYLSEFSTLMRAVLENSEEDFIPLIKEIELLKLYVKLEHSRFSDKFDYDIIVDENIDVSAYQIPPMLLQPYIENAIWHGLRYKEDKGYLNITLKSIGSDSIEIEIEDNGIGRKRSAQLKTQNQKRQKSKGMGNIKKRVAILNDMYKDKIDVHITDLQKNGHGTLVRFRLNKDK